VKPCYRCIFPAPPPPETAPNCSEAGVLGAAVGVMGTLQAIEVLKEILGIGESLAGRLLIYDALAARFRTLKVTPDPLCALCGNSPSIRDLSYHAEQSISTAAG
jgi:adenylyltransferase/sulfurtransferase